MGSEGGLRGGDTGVTGGPEISRARIATAGIGCNLRHSGDFIPIVPIPLPCIARASPLRLERLH